MGIPEALRRTWARLRAPRFRTQFGTVRVYEVAWGGERIRVLDVGGTYQSATYLDKRWCCPPFPYLRLYDCVFEAACPPHDLCMLGGGGYAYPKHVIAHRLEARIDVVEIDPAITDLARTHFFLDRLLREYDPLTSGRLGLFTCDALAYLKRCASTGRHYDAILNDCFAGGQAVQSLLSPQAARLLRSCLVPGGLYLSNMVTALEGAQAAPLMELVPVLAEEFDRVFALSCERADYEEADNVLVIASTCDPQIPHAIPLV